MILDMIAKTLFGFLVALLACLWYNVDVSAPPYDSLSSLEQG
jgi:hypothetical protein